MAKEDGVYGTPWAYDAGFSIETVEPSFVVKEALKRELIPDKSRILDLGCGKNPRNAIFLAHQHSCNVDLVDLEPPEFPQGLPISTFMKIHFRQGSVLEFDYGKEVYRAVVLARLIQYVSPEDLETLLTKVNGALVPKGIVSMSYTAQGGVLNKSEEYKIAAYAHSVEGVKESLEQKGLEILFLQQGASRSTHVPHAGEPAVTYDLIAQKVK